MNVSLRGLATCQLRSFVRSMSAATETATAVNSVEQTAPKQGQKRKHSESESPRNAVDDSPEKKPVHKEIFEDSEYYFQNGLRKVYPYPYRYTTFAKGRWVGRTLIEIFTEEFRARPREYYEDAIKMGHVKIRGENVDANYRMRENDLLSNDSHRHEVPVIGCPIKIVHEDDEMLVIDKPPSIPVHPCGRYRLNSILAILNREQGFKHLHTLHRLDRLTSGILMFAKTKERSQFMDNLMKTRTVQKEYLCRVEGEFPDGETTCSRPVEVFSFKIGVCGASENGRIATTVFRRLSYNGKSSVVLAMPKQGRMHQIRVHLQYLGHPIVNDPLYNSEIFGSNKGKGGLTEKTPAQLVADLLVQHTAEIYATPLAENEIAERREASGSRLQPDEIAGSPVSHPAEDFFKNYPTGLEQYITDDFRETLRAFDPRKMPFEESCPECKIRYVDPLPEKLFMYLHCYSYKGEDFEYTATWPNWAKEDWDLD